MDVLTLNKKVGLKVITYSQQDIERKGLCLLWGETRIIQENGSKVSYKGRKIRRRKSLC